LFNFKAGDIQYDTGQKKPNPICDPLPLYVDIRMDATLSGSGKRGKK
jgi:hypothetical protein